MHKRNLNELILNWSAKRSNKDPAHEEQVIEGLKPHSNLEKLSIRGHGGGTCPSWLRLNLSIENLESLCLDGVDWETFPPIGGELQLVNKGAEETLPSQHLKNLKSIELANLNRLERWVVGSSSGQQLLSHLEVIIIEGCPELVELAFLDCNCSQQDVKTFARNLRRLVIQGCPKLSFLPPVPWTPSPCSIRISGGGLGFKSLSYGKSYESQLSLRITGKRDTQDSALFWTSLDFDKLTKVKELKMEACPPLAHDDLQKRSLKDLTISNCNNAFGPVKDGRHPGYQFAVESTYVSKVGATSGKELTQVLSYMPNLSKLIVTNGENMTGLGVVEQQQEEATACYSSASSRCRSREKEKIEAAEEGLLLLPPKLHELRIASCPELGNGNGNRNRGGLQTLCSLRSLWIFDCPKFLSRYSSSSSSFPFFPTSLQALRLEGVEISKCVSLGHGCCLQELTVLGTTNFFSSDSILPFSIQLSSLYTDDVARALAAPICRLLSSSLTKLGLSWNKEMERFTVEQDEALQLLTSLQHLVFYGWEKLQSLPPGLHRLTSLKTLEIWSCPSIRLLPTKDGLPNSLQDLTIYTCSAIRTLPKKGLPDSLQRLFIKDCVAIRSLPKDSLPNSLRSLTIWSCSAFRTLPKDGLPNPLQNLYIRYCPSIRALPKASLPTSLKLIYVCDCNSEDLKRQCRNLIGSIPILRV